MAGNRFDEFSKALAVGTPRRTLLKLLVAGTLGGILARTGRQESASAQTCNPPPTAQIVQCVQFCNAAFPPDYSIPAQQCIGQAKCGQGPCFQCGPGAGQGHPDVCAGHCCSAQAPNCCPAVNAANGVCTNVASDPNNCGTCGNVCTTMVANAHPTCSGSMCGFACNMGFQLCAGACIPNANCCTAADCPVRQNAMRTCTNGMCGFTCNNGFADCNGMAADGCEVNTTNDAHNCGGCGRQCMTGQTCVNSTCVGGTCGNPSNCPSFGNCGGICACFTRVDGLGGFCSSTQDCTVNCTSNADCTNGVCIRTCCGTKCAPNSSACVSSTIAQITPAVPTQGQGQWPAPNRTTR